MIGPKPALMRRGQIAGAFSDPDAIRTYEILQELIDQSPEAIQQAQDTADDAKSKVDALKATPQFLVLSNTPLLASERAAVFSGGLAGVDGGAGSTYTVDFAAVADQRILANVSGGSAKPTPTAHNLILGIGSALKWTTARTLTLGTHLTGNVAFDGSADFTLNATLATTAVTPGSYTNANITVDAYGRITLAANGSGGGASAFTSLTDVPASYAGQSLKAVRVNAGETGLEFYTPLGGSGTVTSVGLSLPAFLTVSGSPVTGAGTLTAVLATQSANLVFAGPSTGAAAAPTFRAMVAADLPTVDVPHGGTGAVTLTNHGVLLGQGTSAVAATAAGTAGHVLTSNGASADPTFQAPAAGGTPAKVLITEVVTSGSQANVTFSSIPATYRDLEVVVRGRSTNAGTLVAFVYLQFNGDTGANYMRMAVRYAGAAAGIGLNTAQTQIIIEELPAGLSTANYAGAVTARVLDYRGTTFYKNLQGLMSSNNGTGANGQEIAMYSGQWLNTAAINAVKVYFNAGNFVDGSVVSLYGVL